jgi:GH15 family glucan-1,4-alpha-glucosidase
LSGLDLAVIGNCAVASLIDREGRHVWHCLSRLDGDPVFNALLGGTDPQTGFMDIGVRDRGATRQRYLPNSAVLETVIEDGHGGSLRMFDFAPRFERFGRMFRPPMLVRRIEPMAGRPRITLRLRPDFDYGARRPQLTSGSNHVRYVGSSAVLRLTTDAPISYILHETEFALDRPLTLIIGADETVTDGPDTIGRTFLQETELHWQDWVRGLYLPFDWQEAVIRAAITLKLCSYEDTGAVLAALTTSIPEHANSGRNWDYRYCWLRDAFFTVTALNRLSATRTMEGFVRFIVDAVERNAEGSIAPLFAMAPGRSTGESIVQSLAGYRGQGPVRIGNAAVSQRQNDVYGSIVMTAAQMFWDERLPQRGDNELYRQLCLVGEEAARVALQPDAGLWEFRERQRVHTFSSAMCWAAQHRLGMIARRIGAEKESADWFGRAKGLRQEVLKRATVNGKSGQDGWLSGVLDGQVVDASSLVLPEVGLLASKDPRFIATVDMVGKRLLRGGFIMRYTEADDFGEPRNAFLLCTLWYIDALAAVGRREEALEIFSNVLARRNHFGLLSEDIDPATGELWGNFPQTYSQVGLILCAMRLSRSWEEGLWRAS